MAMQVPNSWQHVLAGELDKPYFKKLEAFVDEERRTQTVFPPEDDVFNALKFTPYDKVTVLLDAPSSPAWSSLPTSSSSGKAL